VLRLRGRHRRGLIDATVRIGGDAVGTGFFVAPGLVVTCAHVLPEPGRPLTVTHAGVEVTAEVLVREPADAADTLYSFPDVALLQVPATDHACVLLGGAEPEPRAELYSYGCPVVDGRPFWDHVTLEAEGERVPHGTTHRFLKAKLGQVRPGASGSGVVDEATGSLVGMLKLTRDAGQDLGGVLVPAEVVVDTLAAAGHDVTEANRLATASSDSLAGARRRLRWVLQELENELVRVTSVHRRSMLMEVAAVLGDIPETVTEVEAALALLDLDLEHLGAALSELARACRSADAPRRLLGVAAAFAWIADGRPLVEPQAAALLAAERRAERPRAVHLPVAGERGVRLHAARAAVEKRWNPTLLAAGVGEPDEETGLPVGLVDAIRIEALRAANRRPTTAEQARALWADPAVAARVRDRARELLFVLPEGVADSAALDALRRVFAPCMFVVSGRSLPAALREDAERLLALPESLSESDEAEAVSRYDDILHFIGEQATG
jgi:hypothetical protein